MAESDHNMANATREQVNNTGSKADAPATTDGGTFSLIALIKRLLQRFNSGQVIGSVEQSGSWLVDVGNLTPAGVISDGNTSLEGVFLPTVASPYVGDWQREDRFVQVMVTMSCDVAGTLFFDFYDVDGTIPVLASAPNSTFPVNGFSYSSPPFNEFHQAVKGPRWFRARFVPSATATAFRINTYFVQPALANLPLNQSVQTDQDATVVRAFLSGFSPADGLSKPVAVTDARELAVRQTGAVITQSGSQFVEGVRDDIDVSFDSDNTDAVLATKITVVSELGSGGYSRDLTEGQGVFSTGLTAGSMVFWKSIAQATYEPGHEIVGEQTIEIDTTNLVGDASVEWGYGRDDGAGGLLHFIGMRMTANGTYTVRRKNGVDEYVSEQADWHHDKLDGNENSSFLVAGVPVALDMNKNNLWRVVFEWLGIAPPTFKIMKPEGGVLTFDIDHTPNSQMGTTVPTPRLNLFVRVKNDSTLGGDVSVRCGSWRGGIHTNKADVQIDALNQASTSRVDVGLSAVQLDSTKLLNRRSVEVRSATTNTNNAIVYVGFDNTVTASNGRPLVNGEVWQIDLAETVDLWAIASTAGQFVQLTQVGE